MYRLEWPLLFILAVLWEASFFFGEVALKESPPLAPISGPFTDLLVNGSRSDGLLQCSASSP